MRAARPSGGTQSFCEQGFWITPRSESLHNEPSVCAEILVLFPAERRRCTAAARTWLSWSPEWEALHHSDVTPTATRSASSSARWALQGARLCPSFSVSASYPQRIIILSGCLLSPLLCGSCYPSSPSSSSCPLSRVSSPCYPRLCPLPPGAILASPSAQLLFLPPSRHFLFHPKQWFLLYRAPLLFSFLSLLIAQLNSLAWPEGVTGLLKAPLSLLLRDGVMSWCRRLHGRFEGRACSPSSRWVVPSTL